MKINPDAYDSVVFKSTGRVDDANNGIIGINPKLETYEGYDGHFPVYGSPPDFDLTKEERMELADYMIALWTKYKYKK